MRSTLRILAALAALALLAVGPIAIALLDDTLQDQGALPFLVMEQDADSDATPRGRRGPISVPDLSFAATESVADALADRDLDGRSAALLLAGLLAAPVFGLLLLRVIVVRATGSGQAPPPSGPVAGPPLALPPAEVGGLLLEDDEDVLLIATLADVDQRGALRGRWDASASSLVLQPAESTASIIGRPLSEGDAEFVAELVSDGPLIVATIQDPDLRPALWGATGNASVRRAEVFRDHGLLAPRFAWLESTWFRLTQAVLFALYAFVVGWATASVTALSLEAVIAVVALVLAAATLANRPWRHQQLPLSPEGREAVARAEAFRRFLKTATADDLHLADGQPGIEGAPAAVRLLPYAAVCGYAHTWYDRFGAQIERYLRETDPDPDTVWWLDHDRFMSAWTALTTAGSEDVTVRAPRVTG